MPEFEDHTIFYTNYDYQLEKNTRFLNYGDQETLSILENITGIIKGVDQDNYMVIEEISDKSLLSKRKIKELKGEIKDKHLIQTSKTAKGKLQLDLHEEAKSQVEGLLHHKSAKGFKIIKTREDGTTEIVAIKAKIKLHGLNDAQYEKIKQVALGRLKMISEQAKQVEKYKEGERTPLLDRAINMIRGKGNQTASRKKSGLGTNKEARSQLRDEKAYRHERDAKRKEAKKTQRFYDNLRLFRRRDDRKSEILDEKLDMQEKARAARKKAIRRQRGLPPDLPKQTDQT